MPGRLVGREDVAWVVSCTSPARVRAGRRLGGHRQDAPVSRIQPSHRQLHLPQPTGAEKTKHAVESPLSKEIISGGSKHGDTRMWGHSDASASNLPNPPRSPALPEAQSLHP